MQAGRGKTFLGINTRNIIKYKEARSHKGNNRVQTWIQQRLEVKLAASQSCYESHMGRTKTGLHAPGNRDTFSGIKGRVTTYAILGKDK